KRMSEARSAGARVRTIILGLPIGVDPVALCGGLPTAVARGGFLVRCHAERTRGSHRDAEFHLTHVESTPLGATMESMKTRGSHQGAALMKRTRKYVGLDVHQASTVVSVRGESGRVIWRTVLPTEAE